MAATTQTQSSKIRVAITGGGLAGSTLASALIQNSNLEVSIYESAAQFSERGAAVGISINGQRALALMRLDGVLARAGGVPNYGNRFIVGSGPHAGTLIHEMTPRVDESGRSDETVVHRAALLKELLVGVPPERMFTNKRLADVQERDGAVQLTFADGTRAETDVLFGADGIHGRVRTHILGPDHAALAPYFIGCWDARALHPAAHVRKMLGAAIADASDSRQHDYMGTRSFLLHDLIDGGETVHLALCGTADSWPADAWKVPLTKEKALETLADWPNRAALAELMTSVPDPTMFAEWAHRPAPTYVSRRTAVLGDAAHAMAPFQASGATQALEDALVLATVLAHARSVADVPAALAAYDAVRRPRTAAIAESSLETGRIAMGLNEEVGLEPARLKEALKDRWDFIHQIDLEAHCALARREMDARLGA